MKLLRFSVVYIRMLALAGICALLLAMSFTTVAGATGSAYVRVIHAAAGAPVPVDIYANNNKLLTNFQYNSVSKYTDISTGKYTIRVVPTGKSPNDAVITKEVTVESSDTYTVAAIGDKASDLGLQAFVDHNKMEKGNAQVRVYHLSPDAGPVNITSGGKKVISDLTYKNASKYIEVPAGNYTFDVTAVDANKTIPVQASLKAGTINSIFATGFYKGTPALKFIVNSVNGNAD